MRSYKQIKSILILELKCLENQSRYLKLQLKKLRGWEYKELRGELVSVKKSINTIALSLLIIRNKGNLDFIPTDSSEVNRTLISAMRYIELCKNIEYTLI